MSRTLSALAKASANAQSTGEVWLTLMRINHASITPGGVIRCVNNTVDITGGSDSAVYTAYPFELDIPGEDSEQPAVASIRIDNVDLQIIQAVRGLPSPPTVDFEIVLASQPTTIEISMVGMTMRAADFDALTVEATVTFEEIFTEPVSLDMTPSRFPGMF